MVESSEASSSASALSVASLEMSSSTMVTG